LRPSHIATRVVYKTPTFRRLHALIKSHYQQCASMTTKITYYNIIEDRRKSLTTDTRQLYATAAVVVAKVTRTVHQSSILCGTSSYFQIVRAVDWHQTCSQSGTRCAALQGSEKNERTEIFSYSNKFHVIDSLHSYDKRRRTRQNTELLCRPSPECVGPQTPRLDLLMWICCTDSCIYKKSTANRTSGVLATCVPHNDCTGPERKV